MNIIDEIKLLLWLKKVVNGGVTVGGKIGDLLAKLDGLKSIAGLLMVTAYYVAPQFGVQVPDVVLKIGSGMASVGLAMKLEKGAGVLSKSVDVAHKALDVLQNVVNVLAAKKAAEAPKA